VSLTSKNAKKVTKRKEIIKKENQDLLRMMDSRPKENKDNPRIINSKKLRRMISKW
jgi:transposase